VWHKRLGHPLNQVLSLLSSSIQKEVSSKSKENLYHVCLRAKQTHLAFSISSIKALNCVDLIHVGILGPYHVKSFCGAHYFFKYTG